MGNCIFYENPDDPYVYIYVYPFNESKKYIKCSEVTNEYQLEKERKMDNPHSHKKTKNRLDKINRNKYMRWKNNIIKITNLSE